MKNDFIFQKLMVKRALCIFCSVTVINKIHENIKIFKTEYGLIFGDFLACVIYSPNEIYSPPDIIAKFLPIKSVSTWDSSQRIPDT